MKVFDKMSGMDAKYNSLEGQNVIVVGTGGIGGAIVGDFLEQGSILYALDKNEKVLENLCNPWNADKWGEEYYNDETVRLQKHKIDVTAHEEYRNLIKKIGNGCKPKKIHSFVYAAGLGVSTPIGKTPHEIYEYLYKLNVVGFQDGVEAVVPFMGKGSSITVIASLNAYRSEHGMAGYDATKAALIQYARTTAADLGSKGIMVNSVNPGYVRTPQTIEELKNPVSKKRIEDATVLERVAEPEDVSGVVVAVASDDFRFVTGADIEVSGGLALAQYPPIEKQIAKI